MRPIKLSALLLYAFLELVVPRAYAGLIDFDDLDASFDIDLTASSYQGYRWSNISVYTSSFVFEGYDNGIVSPANAAYTGGEQFDTLSTPIKGVINSTGLFDFRSVYLNAAFYDNLAVTVDGLLNGSVIFSQTVTVNTDGGQYFDFSYSGIDSLAFYAAKTAGISDPFGCGSFNCTQFTLDNITLQNTTALPSVPEPPVFALLVLAGLLFKRPGRVVANLMQNLTKLGLLLVAVSTVPAYADDTRSTRMELERLSAVHFAEPLVATKPTTDQEDEALLAAVNHYRLNPRIEDGQVLTDFIKAYPDSGWRMALETNLGLTYYQAGRFSLAIAAWETAWNLGKELTEPKAKVLVDRALGELMRMHARIGHADRLQALFSEMGDRLITGPATESVAGAREGLWVMHNDPGIAYLCGPMALKNMLLAQGVEPQKIAFISAYRSGNHGVSLTEVGRLAQQAELPHTLIQRQPGQAIPVPSVVHWKVSHFAAIVGEQDGRYHIQDPIFGEDLWVTQKAIDAEASGYFLVPKQTQAQDQGGGWRPLEMAEADSIFGMGYTGSVDPAATKPQDDKIKPGCNGSRGMCTANASEMTVSLNLNDTPVGYAPPIGPAAYVTLTYNQREAGQPANFGFFNVSAKWAMNWLSYIQDSPTLPGSNVSRYVAGGGFVNYSDYNSSTGAFTPEVYDNSVLVRTASEPIRYERRLPDGSIEVYSASNGATVAPRRIFLTQLIDPAGNAMTLSYDDQMRLTTLTDATGRNTVFTYDFAGNPLLITRVTDPFGRSARIEYDANGRLSKITDVIGLSSSFHYNSASLIDSMTTPYGTTAFSFGESGDRRWLEITDPLGAKERVEYRQQAPGIPYSEPSGQVPQGLIAPFNSYINGRNTFYWDRQAFASGVANYSQARIKHWEHWTKNAGVTSAPVESIKYPLENRTWFSYPGQTTWGAVSGTLDKPIRIARVLDDGSTQLTQLSYNSLGNPTRIIDPLGRETQIEYAANQIDVIRIAQKTGTSSYATLAEFTYDNRHLPLTYQDAAGQTTRYAYTPAGKLSEVVNPLGQITNYVYDARGYLTQVLNANGATELTLSYDEFSRVASRTDSEGHTLRYRYDDFDRITQVTYPDGTTEAYGWDKLDLASVTDREGRTTRYAYNAVRKIVASVDPLNRTLQYGYYPNQTLKSLTDANGNVTTWERDLQSRVTAKIYPDGRTDRYGYDLTSRLRSMTDARGQSKRYGYGRDDRLVKIDYRASTITPSATTPSVSFTYDAWFPRQTAMTDGTGTTQYQYVAPGTLGALQLKQSDGPYPNDTVAYQYDALGRVINRNVGGSEETFSFDALGRNISHTSPLGEFNQSYLGETRQLTDTRHRNGLVGTRREYDDNTNDRRLLSIINTGASRNYQFATRPTNIISSIHETAPLDPSTPSRDWTFNYDDADRLEAANSNDGKHYSYQYDPGDNLTNQVKPDGTQAFIVNNLNQVALINDTQVV
ncbi:MAG: hypothetical protein CTY29_01530, partial [Methylobacter sp.]